jgi:rare lipoprotein A (peptidoglycan hydrolase)
VKFLIPLAVLVGIARPAPAPPMRPALASWYDDAGQTASGRHYTYGFASLQFGSEWGRRVRFCHARRCVTGRLDDHGPYVTGRLFDLN